MSAIKPLGKMHFAVQYVTGQMSVAACTGSHDLRMSPDIREVTCQRCIRLAGQRERNIAAGAPRVGTP